MESIVLKIKKFFTNKKIFITGGTGTFGIAMIKFLIKNSSPKLITIYSRDEMKQWHLQEKFKNYNKIKYVLGDVRDKDRLQVKLVGHDYVFHAAATKIVPSSEENPEECIKTNILGAMNVIDACKVNKIKKVIALSTDKASSPISLYGATKLCSDKLFVAQNSSANDTIFGVVRYGNVIGSRGSIIPYFNYLMKNKKPFTITHPDMTRFFVTIEQAVKFSCFGMMNTTGGEIFVQKIKAINIMDLARAVYKDAKFKFIGIRRGEKIHETMIGEDEAMNTAEFKDHYQILPNTDKFNKKKYQKVKSQKFSFSSEKTSKYSQSEFKDIIRKEVFEN